MTNENKELSLTTDNKDGLEYIKALTGEFGLPASTQYISFNGNDGKFYQGSGEAKVEISDTINGTIVRIAKRVETKYKSKVCKTPVRSNEEVYIGGEIELFDRSTGESVGFVDYQEAKEKYDLGYSEILYIALDEMGGEIVKLTVKGSSLSPLWAYLRTPGENASIIQWKTKFKSEEFKSDLGDTFYKIKFEKSGELSKEELQKALDGLSSLNVAPVKSINKANITIDKGDIIDENGEPFES